MNYKLKLELESKLQIEKKYETVKEELRKEL